MDQAQNGASFEQYDPADNTQGSSDRTPTQDYSGHSEDGYAAGESRSLEQTPPGELEEAPRDEPAGKSKLASLFGRGGKKEKKEKVDKDTESKKKKKKGKKDKKHDEDVDIDIEVDTGKEKTKKPGKLSGLFKRKKKEESPVTEEETVVMDVSGESPAPPSPPADQTEMPQGVPYADVYNPSQQSSLQPHPGSYEVNPSDTLTRPPTRSESVKNVTKSLFKRPGPVEDENEEKLKLKQPKSSSMTRCSVFLVVILIAGFVLGIVLVAVAGDDEALEVIGAVLIVLSLMTLIGKIFFTLFMTPDPHPLFRQINDAIKMSMGEKKGVEAKGASYPKQRPPAPVHQQTMINMSFAEELDTGDSSHESKNSVKFADQLHDTTPTSNNEYVPDPTFI